MTLPPCPITIGTVILAAGHNTRLRGIVPTAYKPLLVINGETLIGRLARQALCSRLSRGLHVVTNPLNTAPIVELVPEALAVVQPEPKGPIDALRLAMQMRTHDTSHTMILCADNYVPSACMEFVRAEAIVFPGSLIVSARVVPSPASRRFTRIVGDDSAGNVTFIDSNHGPEAPHGLHEMCWIGPLIVPTRVLDESLKAADHVTFSGLLNHIAPKCLRPQVRLIMGEAQDIGTPDELVRATSKDIVE